jgi:predicted acyl esterase
MTAIMIVSSRACSATLATGEPWPLDYTGERVTEPANLSREELAANRADYLGDVLAHPLSDSFYRERTPDLSKIDYPALVIANWGGRDDSRLAPGKVYYQRSQILTHHVLPHAGIHASKMRVKSKMCMIGHQAAGRSRTATLGIRG